jgi:pyrroloquinoline-quinone synthase
MTAAWDRETFLARLREVGARTYHDKHPFHVAMNAGTLTSDAVRGWVANRFCYQRSIPIKDAAILSNCPIREVRRIWIHRIADHDGTREGEGGIEKWLRLGEACGLSHRVFLVETHVIPAARFAVEAYVHFARTQPWPIAIASSLTELFAPDLMARRIEAFRQHYKWIAEDGLGYFTSRVTQAARDSGEALEIVLQYCDSREMQEAAVGALDFKCDVLWSLLDAIQVGYAPELPFTRMS